MHHTHGFKKRPVGFTTKIVAINLAVIVTVFVITGALLYYSLHGHLAKNEYLIGAETLSNLSDYMQQKQEMVFGQYTLLHKRDNVSDLFYQIQYNGADPYAQETIEWTDNYLAAIFTADSDISNFMFLGPKGTFYSESRPATNNASPGYDYSRYFVVSDLMASAENFVTEYDPAPAYLYNNREPVITFAGKIHQFQTPAEDEVLGCYLINLPISAIEEEFEKYFSNTNCEFYLVNGAGKILFSTKNSAMGKLFQEPQAKNILVKRSYVDPRGTQAIMLLDSTAPLRSIGGLRTYFILLLFGAMVAVSLLTYLLHRAMHQKLDQLATTMYKVQDGNLSLRLPVTGNDEISQLSEQFNEMCARLQRFISLNYVAETQKRMAQINALQAQINPHFLYNTINCIREKILSNPEDPGMVADMMLSLANLFRYSADISENIVYLEDELDYVESYLEMQHMRFGDGFHYEINVPTNLHYMGIPKLILQPLIENAVVHGLTDLKDAQIIVSARQQNDNLILTVDDNGCGMSPEQVDEMNQYLRQELAEPDHHLGIGIKNVHDRIHLLFSGSSGLSVRSALQVGTRITVTLPVMPKEEMQTCIES